ncbi:hypothetical protein C5O80_04200 [Burkholderia sp. SRS-46]|nr:hypothetical protein C5O80_04200 [Burkholderia sp. SRS-46]
MPDIPIQAELLDDGFNSLAPVGRQVLVGEKRDSRTSASASRRLRGVVLMMCQGSNAAQKLDVIGGAWIL